MEITKGDIVLCEFYFSNLQKTKKRPVMVFKDNLPFDDFIGIPISSKIEKLKNDELLLNNDEFKIGDIPKVSKLIIRKPFAISKDTIIKTYGRLTDNKVNTIQKKFCYYFGC